MRKGSVFVEVMTDRVLAGLQGRGDFARRDIWCGEQRAA